MLLLPAIDLRGGEVVRLKRGLATEKTVYSNDPVAFARKWEAGGADWLHLVDLDAAFGRGSNAELIAAIIDRLSLNVELSGGLRDDGSLERALATGCRRINIGTAALESPEWCKRAIGEYGDRVAVGLDVQFENGSWRLRGRGWETDGGDLWDVLERLDGEGCSRYVVTDVTKDGTLTGPNLDLLSTVAGRTKAPIIASGGVSSLDDLRAIATLTGQGVEGAIVGKALYAERFTLPEALAAVK